MLVICAVLVSTGMSTARAQAVRASDLISASKIAPTAPIEADSVGVATPPRIDPSTARMSRIGAISASTSRCASANPWGAPGSGGIAGEVFGKNTAMPIRKAR
jgi:hypothetical protein